MKEEEQVIDVSLVQTDSSVSKNIQVKSRKKDKYFPSFSQKVNF